MCAARNPQQNKEETNKRMTTRAVGKNVKRGGTLQAVIREDFIAGGRRFSYCIFLFSDLLQSPPLSPSSVTLLLKCSSAGNPIRVRLHLYDWPSGSQKFVIKWPTLECHSEQVTGATRQLDQLSQFNRNSNHSLRMADIQLPRTDKLPVEPIAVNQGPL